MHSISTSVSNLQTNRHSNAGRILIPLICLLSLSGVSCKKFLASYSQNNSFVETAADLDELLVGDAYFSDLSYYEPQLFVMDDDADLGPPAYSSNPFKSAGFHHWQANPRITSEGVLLNSDIIFTNTYKRIARINTILHNVPLLKAKAEPSAILQRISGEAHFLRAYYYFLLVNAYGKPYKPATASSDFGVPVKTDPAIKDQFATRSTTKQVYDQIIADLLAAATELEGFNLSTTIRANQAAVYCLLSRVYLFMENYEKALEYADKVINRNGYLIADLNNHIAGKDFLKRNSQEVVFTMKQSQMPSFGVIFSENPGSEFYKVSNELAMLYAQGDLRREVFFLRSSKGYLRVAKKREATGNTIDDVSDMYLLRLSELYLNKAEALAAMDRFEEAATTLQELRKKRFKPANLTVITSTGGALMSAIRDERRLELCFEAHRWFDLRRYGVNSKYPYSKSIRHTSYTKSGNGYVENGYYELGPYDQEQAAYIIPIANDEIEFNRGSLTNEPRPDRPLKQ